MNMIGKQATTLALSLSLSEMLFCEFAFALTMRAIDFLVVLPI
jgi:hypothetical protein